MKTKNMFMPSYLWHQLDFISKGVGCLGGYFAGTSKNRNYAKKQHIKFCSKCTQKIDVFTITLN